MNRYFHHLDRLEPPLRWRLKVLLGCPELVGGQIASSRFFRYSITYHTQPRVLYLLGPSETQPKQTKI